MRLHDSYGCHPEAISRLKYGISEVWQSGRLRLTVNQVLTARWFESISLHQKQSLSLTGLGADGLRIPLLIVGNVTFDSDLKGPKYPTHIEWCGKESRDSVVGSLAKSRDG